MDNSRQLWPADKVSRRPVNSLIPYGKNARTHSEQQIAQIAASITQFGFTVPALVDMDGVLIAGHGRVLAARSLGLETIPVMVADGWSQTQIRAYRLADNKLTLNGAWDDDALAFELGELRDDGFDLALTGFGEDELADLLTEPDFAPGVADDQGRLDEKKTAVCPECGHEFTP